jgi:hypothetical protein
MNERFPSFLIPINPGGGANIAFASWTAEQG